MTKKGTRANRKPRKKQNAEEGAKAGTLDDRDPDVSIETPKEDILREDPEIRQLEHAKIMVTTSRRPRKATYKFCEEILYLFKEAEIHKRAPGEKIKDIITKASDQGYTSIVYINESNKIVDGLAIINLPNGPTAYFRLSRPVKSKDIKGHGKAVGKGECEIITKNFTTRIGRTVERLLRSLFPVEPNLKIRQVVCLNNKRDYIFFRRYRYIFGDNSCSLQELGPRFTLRPIWLQKGAFDINQGDYIWKYENDSGASRRTYLL